MKKLILFLFFFVSSISFLSAQAPAGFKYQAVARDASNMPYQNKYIALKVSLLKGSASGVTSYSERHTVITSSLGVFDVYIGGGTALSGSFSNINWGANGYFLKIEMDITGNANYSYMGTTQLLSVPYALSAKKSEDNPWSMGNGSIRYDGNVGLGTSTPEFELDVNGSIQASASIIAKSRFRLRPSSTTLIYGGVTTDGEGTLSTYTPAGVKLASFSASASSDAGWMGVKDTNGSTKAAMYVNSSGAGVIYGDVKNFVVDHPNRPGKSIVYASLEGPEAAAYERGTAALINGKAIIDFSEHFTLIANPSSMTVVITPLSENSKGIAVVLKSSDGFSVKELFQGEGNYFFDWEVKCKRIGYEDYEVIRNTSDFYSKEAADNKE